MRKLLWDKVNTISTMKEYLLDTGTRPLIEATGNMFLGAGLNPPDVTICPLKNLPGQNRLGRLWMEIREAIRTDDIPDEYKKPAGEEQSNPRLRMNRQRLLQH